MPEGKSKRRFWQRKSKKPSAEEMKIDQKAQGSAALPQTPAKGGGKDEEKTDVTQTPETPDTTAAAGLTPKERTKLAKKKNGLLHKAVVKTKGWTAPGPYNEEMDEPESDEDKAKKYIGMAMDVMGELPTVGKAIKALKNVGEIIWMTIDAIRNRMEDKYSKEENLDTVLEVVEKVAEAAGNVNEFLGEIAVYAGAAPIVGGIITCISAALSFVKDVKKAIKASISLKRMKDQKKRAKADILAKQGSAGYVTQRHSKGNVFKVGKAGLHFDGKDFGKTTDDKTGKARNKRLDEVTSDQKRGGNESEEEQGLRRSLEDYDVAKELTGANEKRLKESIINIFANDALSFIGGLAAMDPEGIGSGICASIQSALAAAGFAKKIVVAGRQLGRNKGFKGFSSNKSDHNKKVRRHNLAVTTFERIKELNDYNLESIDPATTDQGEADQVRQGLGAYQMVGARLVAMGSGYGPVSRAKSAQEMVNVMRNGFYREA